MGAGRLPMRRICDILRLRHEGGLSHRAIARSSGVGLGTVCEYLSRAAQAGLSWPLPAELDEAALEARLYPAPASTAQARSMPDCTYIHQELKRTGVTLQLLWEEFEAHQTPESWFANALDRLQPIINNYYTNGETWNKHGIKRHQVVKRNSLIEGGAPTLWQYTLDLIQKAIAQGILTE